MGKSCEVCKDNMDMRDYHGRCLGKCRECDEHLVADGRYTVYCPSCDVCPSCSMFDGHAQDCEELAAFYREEKAGDEDEDATEYEHGAMGNYVPMMEYYVR